MISIQLSCLPEYLQLSYSRRLRTRTCPPGLFVMRVALPAALTMVGTLVLTEVLSPFWNGEDLLSSLYHLVLGGMVSLIVVYRVCMPMTRYHKVLCVGLTVIFAAGLVIAPGFLGIHRLDCWQSVLLIPMICMVCVLNQ